MKIGAYSFRFPEIICCWQKRERLLPVRGLVIDQDGCTVTNVSISSNFYDWERITRSGLAIYYRQGEAPLNLFRIGLQGTDAIIYRLDGKPLQLKDYHRWIIDGVRFDGLRE